MSNSKPDDPFSRVNYRSLIAWPARIEREWPFLDWGLSTAPQRSVLDLGCGTGEHVRFLAAHGFRAVGVDVSKAQIEKAREYAAPPGQPGPTFIEADILDLPNRTRDRFGAAICLGNVLPYMDDAELESRMRAVAQILLPGAVLLVQILNYTRILERGIRHLPLNFRPDPEDPNAEIVWVRLMQPAEPGYILFHPLTLRRRPGHDPPIEIQAVREVRLRAWTWPQLEASLRRCGFDELRAFGDMQRGAYVASESNDLIIHAQRRP